MTDIDELRRRRVSRRRWLQGAVALIAGAGLPPLRALADAVRRRSITSSGETLPVIGLGTSRTFNVGASQRQPLREVMRLFVERGGSLVDTSPMYGAAESVLGELAAELALRSRLFLATKVWTNGAAEGIRQMQESARLLRSPVLDLMQVHNLVDWRTQLATLRDWKAAGRIRYIGVTHYHSGAFERLESILRAEPLDFLQINYSLAEPEAQLRLLPLARERGVAVLVNRPFARGRLFGRVRGQELPAWAAEFDCHSWAQLFLKYVLAEPAVTCVLPATGKPHHLLDNMAAGEGRLPDTAQVRRIRSLWAQL